MKLKLRFQGDYANEFGKHPQGYSRIWKAYHIVNNEQVLPAEVWQEPDYTDGGIYFNLWKEGEYLGKFKTRQALYKAI